MLNQFFGHYLLNKGFLTHNQLCEILQSEQNVKVKLGILAVEAGLMTAAQVESIHHLQWSQDKKFGELAIQQGYLTEVQVNQLLDSQQKGHLTLMQAITDSNYMTLNEVEAALAAFRKEYSITENMSNAEDSNKIIKKLVGFSDAGDKADLLYDYIGLLLRNVVRFLNGTPFDVRQVTEIPEVQWSVSQQIVGDLLLETGILMDEAVLLETASRFYGEKLLAPEEMALGSVGEFLNVHNGVFGGVLSEHGLTTDLEPPVVKKADNQAGTSGYHIAIRTSFGQFVLVLFLNKG